MGLHFPALALDDGLTTRKGEGNVGVQTAMKMNVQLLPIRWPETLPESVAVALGVLVGLIFALTWVGSGKKPVAFKDDPRIKGLMWALASAFGSVFAAWNEILGDKTIDRAAIGSYYAFTLIVSVLFFLFWLTLAVIWQARSVDRAFAGSPQMAGFSPGVEFLIYGYQHVRNTLDEIRQNMLEKELSDLKRVVSLAAKNLAASLVSADRNLSQGVSNQSLISTVLDQISSISTYYLRSKSHANANWMIAIPSHELRADDKSKVRYTYGDTARYSYYLALRDYANNQGSQDFILPVENRDDQASLGRTLPGAPEAFIRREHLYVSTKDLTFAPEVPKSVKDAIAGYFKQQKFTCFVSLILYGDNNTPLGIVNIESDNDAVDKRRMTDLGVALEPFLALLSLVIRTRGQEH